MKALALFLLAACAALPTASATASGMEGRQLSLEFAEETMGQALARHPALHFPGNEASQGRTVACSRHISRLRVECSTYWSWGRYGFYGPGQIWVDRAITRWFYSYRITRYDERCTESFSIPCDKTFVVR